MEIDKLNPKQKEERQEAHHLSGAYIRCLVKQLSSSSSSATNKEAMTLHKNEAYYSVLDGDGEIEHQTQKHKQQQHKKQVRRRLHTSRHYQERLLNMAEARREIITALKFHRAAMKQANEQKPCEDQKQLQKQQQEDPCCEQDGRIKSRRNPIIYPSSSSQNYPNSSPPPSTSSNSLLSPLYVGDKNMNNLNLPTHPLGLNLNFQNFNNLDTTTLFQSNNHNSPSSPSSTSNDSPNSIPFSTLDHHHQEIPPNSNYTSYDGSVTQTNLSGSATSSASGGGGAGRELHVAVDEDEMAEIRSMGEQHQMEWSDTMNLVSSARWFKFLKATEPELVAEEGNGLHPFNEVMEFPEWLNPNEDHIAVPFQ